MVVYYKLSMANVVDLATICKAQPAASSLQPMSLNLFLLRIMKPWTTPEC